jgi:hypothetical protein
MSASAVPESEPLKNQLLAHLPPREWALLQPHAVTATLTHAEMLFDDHDPGDVTYFPQRALFP